MPVWTFAISRQKIRATARHRKNNTKLCPRNSTRPFAKVYIRPSILHAFEAASPEVATSAKLKVCYRRQPGKHMLVLSFTRFDPKRKNTANPNLARAWDAKATACQAAWRTVPATTPSARCAAISASPAAPPSDGEATEAAGRDVVEGAPRAIRPGNRESRRIGICRTPVSGTCARKPRRRPGV
jgi:hypothetical protein